MTPNTPMPKSASVEGSGTDTAWHFFGVLPDGPQPFWFWATAAEHSATANPVPHTNRVKRFIVRRSICSEKQDYGLSTSKQKQQSRQICMILISLRPLGAPEWPEAD